MKKIIISSICLMYALCMSAQHMKFQGLIMGLSYQAFKEGLLERGYKYIGTQDDAYTYTGIFAGYKVDIGVSILPRSKKVYMVNIILLKHKSMIIIEKNLNYTNWKGL